MNENNFIISLISNFVQHYNHKSYWKMRNYVVSQRGIKLLKLFYLFRIKIMDAFNGASFGTHFGYGARFESTPDLPHGIKGIIVSHNAKVGKNATIFHQVTIGEGKGGAPIIGDNVLLGAGAKIIGKIRIGNNVRIGANCVVVEDVPDNTTVVLSKPRMIYKNGGDCNE